MQLATRIGSYSFASPLFNGFAKLFTFTLGILSHMFQLVKHFFQKNLHNFQNSGNGRYSSDYFHTARHSCLPLEGKAPARSVNYIYLNEVVVSFWMTSWAPPSTMLVAETRVSLAFC